MAPTPIPDLHEVVLRALDLHASYEIPRLQFAPASTRLVIASGNALPTGQVVFSDEPAIFSDEGQYSAALDRYPFIDSAVVVSASGEKHAPVIISDLLARGLSPYLITCSPNSPAAVMLPPERVLATRSIQEPITYNTSTYMGMMLAKTREDTSSIKHHLLANVLPLITGFEKFEAFYIMVPPHFELVAPMFITKFDELFGGRLTGRCYTTEQTLHAKTVVPWEKELFIGIGVNNEDFGLERLNIPLPDNAGYVAMMATGYFLIGHIQAQKPAWFKAHAVEYAARQKALFERRASIPPPIVRLK